MDGLTRKNGRGAGVVIISLSPVGSRLGRIGQYGMRIGWTNGTQALYISVRQYPQPDLIWTDAAPSPIRAVAFGASFHLRLARSASVNDGCLGVSGLVQLH